MSEPFFKPDEGSSKKFSAAGAPGAISGKPALLLAVIPPGADAREECGELSELASVAGYFCAAMHAAPLRRPKAATLVGAGAVETAGDLAERFGAGRVIVGADLSSLQARNLERAWKMPVIDRTDLILEIFSSRARVHESKLQVELARTRRALSRLAGRWTHLERQRGGIGLRGGPGEKQMEIDRRLLAEKIKRIERKTRGMAERGASARARRAKNGILTAALVGYTNAGKSTLFNSLVRAGVPASGRLFETVDSTTRRIFVGDSGEGEAAVVSDTVGFIRNLPHELLTGFHATLQEAASGDVIAVVADSAHPECEARLQVVHDTLDTIGADRDRRLLVMNKIDKTGDAARIARGPCGKIRTVWVSGASGAGLSGLRQALHEAARQKDHETNETSQNFSSEPVARH